MRHGGDSLAAEGFGADFDLAQATGEPAFTVDLDGFEGPLDLLLELARRQRVDLARISILALAEQYLRFVEAARKLRLELAADYLVMAAWLAFLKSRLLLPAAPEEPAELDAPALAEGLAQRLRALAAIRKAGEHLMSRPRLGRDFFARGEPEAAVETSGRISYQSNLYDLLAAYARQSQRHALARVRFKTREVWSLAEARQALTRLRWRAGRLDGFRQFSARGLRRFRHAPERARVHFRGVARTRARGQDRTAPGEGLRADLAPPDGDRSGRRARSMTFARSCRCRRGAVPPTAERAIREPSRAPSSRRIADPVSSIAIQERRLMARMTGADNVAQLFPFDAPGVSPEDVRIAEALVFAAAEPLEESRHRPAPFRRRGRRGGDGGIATAL